MTTTTGRPRRRDLRKRRLHPLAAIGQLISGILLIAGITGLMQIGYNYVGSTLDTDTTSRRLEQATTTPITQTVTDKTATLRDDDPPVQTAPAEGDLIGWVRVPSKGRDWRLPIQEGTTDRVLANMGAGHYEGTAMPGQVGNSSYAGHDVPGGFGALYDMREGEQIIIEGLNDWYVYQVTSTSIVDATQTGVIGPDAAGATRGLTLTTCYPMFTPTDTGQRFIIHAALAGWAPKTDGLPASLASSTQTTTQKAGRVVRTVSERVDMPVTGVMAVCLALMWLVADSTLWMLTWRRTHATWRAPSANPVTWAWRLQAGQLPGPKWVAWLPRLVPTVLLLGACTFALWRWGSPWLAANVPWLGLHQPGLG